MLIRRSIYTVECMYLYGYMKMVHYIAALLSMLLLFASCQENAKDLQTIAEAVPYEWTLPEEIIDYSIIPPDVMPQLFANTFFNGNMLSTYSVSNEKATLGRVLFYDKRLSRDNTVSCASCHLQEHAFATQDQFSAGIDGQLTPKNSMSLVNLRWSRRFFWDQRELRLEEQVLQPIAHPEEMDQDVSEVVLELGQIEAYGSLFEAAYDDPTITAEGIAEALASFLRALVSFDSKYDQGRPDGFSNFTESEERGRVLFFNNRCNQCHTSESFFASNEPTHNGLALAPGDDGFFIATGNAKDIGKFKTVTLRNIGLTPPYMHDGRFENLHEVVRFYNEGIQAHPNLDDRLTEELEIGGTPVRLGLSDQDIDDLVAFLHTLSDEGLVQSEKYANPFPH